MNTTETTIECKYSEFLAKRLELLAAGYTITDVELHRGYYVLHVIAPQPEQQSLAIGQTGRSGSCSCIE